MTTDSTTKRRTGQKRGNNEGTIRQRSNGMWEARVTLADGKRKSVYGRTRQEAQTKLTAVMRDVQQGLPVPTGRQTLGQFLNRWLADVVKPSTRPSTYRNYEGAVRLHIVPALGKTPLDRLTPQHLQAAFSAMTAKGVSPYRVGYVRTVLRTALNRAVKWQLLPRNPAALTDAPRWTGRHVTALTDEHARTLLAAFDADPHGVFYTTALALGLRRGEALGLRWTEVNLDEAGVTVTGQFQHIEGAWRRVEPKTPRSRRTLPLPAFLVARLRAWRVQSLEQRLVAGPAWQDFDLVFPTANGTPHHGENVSHRFQKFLKSAGLPPMRLHDLRHGAATLLLAQGVDLRTIADILGHSQVSITADLYSHVSVAMKRRAAAAMDAVMGG